jgi:hypothetical protein
MKLSKKTINNIINNLSVDNTEIDTNQLVEAINIKVSKNTKSNLWKLLTEFKVEIPIIQRDYAQGREDDKSKTILNQFVKDLRDTITKNDKNLELDFIYGEINEQTFKPLDGQQRLTTLFLLYWLIAYKSENQIVAKEVLSKFTYETRISSREFVHQLANFQLNGIGTKISEQIIDSPNFFLQWQQDPTIKGMLHTLDKIEELLKDIDYQNAWDVLISKDCPISFNWLPLNDIGLTDDLYIKMNARGKALSPFENFKAKFEGHIEKWEKKEEFSRKLDLDYTDLFWSKKVDTNTFDNIYLKFIAETAILNYAENSTDKEFATKRIKELNDDFTQVSPEIDFKEPLSFEFLEKYLDTYVKYPSLTLDNMIGWDNLWKTNENELLRFFIVKPTYNQRVLFYAQTYFLTKIDSIDENKEHFLNWMRVVRNIVQNTTIGNETFISVIQLVKDLVKGYLDIYSHLSQNNLKLTSYFAKEQVEEEVVKAKLIISENIKWKSQIQKTEDDNFLKGKILFLLDFSKENEVINFDLFEKKSNLFMMLFKDRDDLLRRALLACHDYKIWDGYTHNLGAHRYSLLNQESEWKNWISTQVEDKYEKNLLKSTKIILEYNFEIEREFFLSQVIENYNIKDWKYEIIKDEKHLSFSSQKRFSIKYIGDLNNNPLIENVYIHKSIKIQNPDSFIELK